MELNLKDKGTLVQSLWDSVNGASGDLANIPGLVRRIIETKAWRERIHRGKTYKHPNFLSFITSKPLAGCGWPPEKVEALIRDDTEVLNLWRSATTNPAHRPAKSNYNIISKSRQGTSRSYTLDRLKRERPDLFQKVVDKELSANAAAIEAGFRPKPTPEQQVDNIIRKWNEDRLRILMKKIKILIDKQRSKV